jgi:hypothetical protein
MTKKTRRQSLDIYSFWQFQDASAAADMRLKLERVCFRWLHGMAPQRLTTYFLSTCSKFTDLPRLMEI